MQALHEAISALSLQLFNFSFKWSTAEVYKCYSNLTHQSLTHSEHSQITLCAFFYQPHSDASEGRHSTLVQEFLNIRVPTEARYTEHLLASRLVRKYKPTQRYEQNNAITPRNVSPLLPI